MRNNVYSDTFWYGDMFLPVWAKNENFAKFHIQYIWKIVRGWHHQFAHLNIHKDWSRNVFRKNLKFQNVISSLFLIQFSSFFHCSIGKNVLSFKIDSILEWISPLRLTNSEKNAFENSSFSKNVFDVFLRIICDNHKRVMAVDVDLAIDVEILMWYSQICDNSGFKESMSIRKSHDFLRAHRLCT